MNIISGGQTGADQAGWIAAKKFGLIGDFGGWMPKGFKTEAGPMPEFASLYNAKEHTSSEYPPRTRANAAKADVTLWFGVGNTLGLQCTRKACKLVGQEVTIVYKNRLIETVDLLRHAKCVNIAGNRESMNPGICKSVEDFLSEVFKRLGYLELT